MTKLDQLLEEAEASRSPRDVRRLLAIVEAARQQRNGAVIAHFLLAGKAPSECEEGMKELDEDLHRSAMEVE